MNKKSIITLLCFALACLLVFGTVITRSDIYAAGKADAVSNLKKLKKTVRKKKKLSKVYKTEEAGTGTVDWQYYKHKANITSKENKIYFKDHIYYKQKKLTIGEYSVSMVMKVGEIKPVSVSVVETRYKWKYAHRDGTELKSAKKGKKLPRKTITINPSTYKYSRYTADESNYYSELHSAMRCWDKLLKKNAGLSMKKIGFKKFKARSISDEGYFYNK